MAEQQNDAPALDINDVRKAREAQRKAEAQKEALDNAPWVNKAEYQKTDTFTFRIVEKPYVGQAKDRNSGTKRFFEDGSPVPMVILTGQVSNATHDEDGLAKLHLVDNWLYSLNDAIEEAGGPGLPNVGDTLVYESLGLKGKKKLHGWTWIQAGADAAPKAEVPAEAEAEVKAPIAGEYVDAATGEPYDVSGLKPNQVAAMVGAQVIKQAA